MMYLAGLWAGWVITEAVELGLLLRCRKIIIKEPLRGLIHSLSSREVKLIETGSGNGDREVGSCYLMGTESLLHSEKFLEIGCTTT